jgi:hypothetical protein
MTKTSSGPRLAVTFWNCPLAAALRPDDPARRSHFLEHFFSDVHGATDKVIGYFGTPSLLCDLSTLGRIKRSLESFKQPGIFFYRKE